MGVFPPQVLPGANRRGIAALGMTSGAAGAASAAEWNGVYVAAGVGECLPQTDGLLGEAGRPGGEQARGGAPAGVEGAAATGAAPGEVS